MEPVRRLGIVRDMRDLRIPLPKGVIYDEDLEQVVRRACDDSRPEARTWRRRRTPPDFGRECSCPDNRSGGPVSDDQNSLKIGARGPTVLEDFHFREKIFHFDHERIPERVVHARGYGAHGYFET